jgi:hypothetical protein
MKNNKEENHSSVISSGWEVNVAKTLEEIEELRHIWNEMQSREPLPAFDADIDRYLSDIETKKNFTQPYIISLFREDKPVAMIIAQIEKRYINIRLGYKTLFNPGLKCLTITYGGIFGRKDGQTCIIIMQLLLEKLRENEVDVIYLNHLDKDSQFYKLSEKMPGILMRSHFPQYEKHWLMLVPDDIEQFYQSCSPSSRKQYKKIQRKFEREYTGRYKIIIYNSENDWSEGINAAEKISRKTYQWRLGNGFKNDETNRILLTTAAKKDWLYLPVLYIDGEPCAFENWIKYNGRYVGHGIGFDPKWKQWRIGTILFLNTIKHICKDNSIKIIDFGFGDAEYKQSFGTTFREEASMFLFAPRFYPVFVNIILTCFSAVNSGLKYTADKFGFKNSVKRLWRDRLARNAS